MSEKNGTADDEVTTMMVGESERVDNEELMMRMSVQDATHKRTRFTERLVANTRPAHESFAMVLDLTELCQVCRRGDQMLYMCIVGTFLSIACHITLLIIALQVWLDHIDVGRSDISTGVVSDCLAVDVWSQGGVVLDRLNEVL